MLTLKGFEGIPSQEFLQYLFVQLLEAQHDGKIPGGMALQLMQKLLKESREIFLMDPHQGTFLGEPVEKCLKKSEGFLKKFPEDFLKIFMETRFFEEIL